MDGKNIPGSVDVKVYANEPGEKYNIGLSDFTIPVLKETQDLISFMQDQKHLSLVV